MARYEAEVVELSGWAVVSRARVVGPVDGPERPEGPFLAKGHFFKVYFWGDAMLGSSWNYIVEVREGTREKKRLSWRHCP